MSMSSMSPSGLTVTAASLPSRRRGLEMLAILLTCCAVAGGGAWGPVSAMAALALRPSELNQVSQYSDVELRAVIDPARQQLWIITLVSLLVLAALAGTAILVGRRALRGRVSERLLAQLGSWALWCLVSGLALGLLPFLILFSLPSRFSFLPTDTGALLVSLILAGAIGSAILASVALSRPTSRPVSTGTETSLRWWRRRTRLCLGAATIIGLAAFALLSVAAQFMVGFYFRFVF